MGCGAFAGISPAPLPTMRVGLLAPLLERIPPGNYGGTERVMAWLADELVALGLDVDLFASGDCDTRARLVSLVPRALWHDEGIRDYTAVRVAALARAYAIAAVDVMHDHAELLAYPLARAAAFPTVSTLHSRTDTRECAFVYDEFREHPLVAISHAQRRPLPKANWVATVHHGMPADLYRPSYARGSYLAFVGRIAPEKGVQLAIEVARRTGLPLKIAGRPPLEEWKYLEARTDHEYYETMVRPYLGTDGIEYVGELDDAGKQDLYEGALALLFPIDWPEPFGLVLIEAMACGTPIPARPREDRRPAGHRLDEHEAMACGTPILARPRGDRRPAGHRLDEHEAERLRPVDREEQRERAFVEILLSRVVELPDVFDAVGAEVRADHRLVVLVIGPRLEVLPLLERRPPRDLQRQARPSRDLDREMDALLRRDPADEREERPPGVGRPVEIGRHAVEIGRAH